MSQCKTCEMIITGMFFAKCLIFFIIPTHAHTRPQPTLIMLHHGAVQCSRAERLAVSELYGWNVSFTGANAIAELSRIYCRWY